MQPFLGIVAKLRSLVGLGNRPDPDNPFDQTLIGGPNLRSPAPRRPRLDHPNTGELMHGPPKDNELPPED